MPPSAGRGGSTRLVVERRGIDEGFGLLPSASRTSTLRTGQRGRKVSPPERRLVTCKWCKGKNEGGWLRPSVLSASGSVTASVMFLHLHLPPPSSLPAPPPRQPLTAGRWSCPRRFQPADSPVDRKPRGRSRRGAGGGAWGGPKSPFLGRTGGVLAPKLPKIGSKKSSKPEACEPKPEKRPLQRNNVRSWAPISSSLYLHKRGTGSLDYCVAMPLASK